MDAMAGTIRGKVNEMERLTELHDGIWGISVKAIENGHDRYSAYSRLAAYEDTELTPEEIKAACEKQTPRKVELRKIKRDFSNNPIQISGICPVCKAYVSSKPVGDSYCFNCGQKLDWEDME